MGMAAGQARLLSITAKLTDNELRSQTITNAKLRLATESSEASQAYMDALNTTKLMYSSYDDNGSLSYQSLTANTLLTYGDLKNQYSLVNSSGQIMLNGSDIKKYEAVDNLTDYLYSYGIAKSENPKYAEALMDIYGKNTTEDGTYLYEQLYDENNELEWNEFCSNMINNDSNGDGLPDSDLDGDGINDSYISYLESILQKPSEQLTQNDADIFTQVVSVWTGVVNNSELNGVWKNMGGTFGAYMYGLLNLPNVEFPDMDDYRTETGTELANAFDLASKPCYQNAMGGSEGCYIHVLAHLLDLKSTDVNASGDVDSSWGNTYTTTIGGYTIDTNGEINGSAINSDNLTASMAPVSEFICADDGKNVMAPATGPEITSTSADVDKLLSNYKIDESGEMVQKTFKEKIIDLYYVVEHYNDDDMTKSDGTKYTYEELKEYLANFQTDMIETLNTVSEDYYEAVDSWRARMLKWLEDIFVLQDNYLESIEKIPSKEIPDKNDPKYQWYVNLWYRMGASGENKNEYDKANYKELDENLINNSEWLEFALEHGILTMEQASFTENGSEKYPGMGTYDWVSIIYTNAADLKSQEDETAIALAEVKYKNIITEIENKDKKYDQDLKKLDTEHNALQTEYESLKSTIDKNVERSFKAFS